MLSYLLHHVPFVVSLYCVMGVTPLVVLLQTARSSNGLLEGIRGKTGGLSEQRPGHDWRGDRRDNYASELSERETGVSVKPERLLERQKGV